MPSLLIVIIAKVMAINNRMAVWCVSLGREGRPQELQLEQFTIENLRQMFQVSLAIVSITLKYLNHVLQVYPSKAWLRDEVDRAIYLP